VKVKEGKIVAIFKDTLKNSHINGELSTRPIDMVVDRFIFKNNQITLYPCFTLPETGVGIP